MGPIVLLELLTFDASLTPVHENDSARSGDDRRERSRKPRPALRTREALAQRAARTLPICGNWHIQTDQTGAREQSMCQSNECEAYLPIFAASLHRRRIAVVTLLVAMAVTALIGAGLILASLFLVPAGNIASEDMLKIGLGLLAAKCSYLADKEILVRWTAFVPFEVSCSALRRCSVLSPAELEAHWAIAKELAKKL